ncbi:sel1 repeat family protein [Pyxidicoccus fallax]|uniref:Sel1 repeat family protein n=1 Tax=Pyxidicoccus fallax TaxID=394095 RepID=A0A848LBP0_9BACT|nr:tetratricopeptide repeat protein [Pyxidicoccus fallax]NMO15652.1 sel1 repeat family protein [Pyxidicoccus fallax]NPC80651.1 sel1 repeat family protein [Pyxidicoccus fallax]
MVLFVLSGCEAFDSGPTLDTKAQRAEAEKQPAEALRLYTRACDKGVLTSCLRQGRLLAEGVGTEKNEAEAMKPWLRACDGQVADACAAAASVLARTPAEVKRAQELDKKACELGRQASCVEQALRVIDGLQGKLDDAPMADKEEYGRAFDALRSACGAGDSRGCELVCSKTKGLDTDSCRSACDKGATRTCHFVAQSYLAQEKRDFKQAQSLEEKACEGDEPVACLTLIRLGRRGWFKGVKQAALAKRACELGDCSAACELGDAQACDTEARRLAAQGDAEVAKAYAVTACRRGLASSCSELDAGSSGTAASEEDAGTDVPEEDVGTGFPARVTEDDTRWEWMRLVCGVEPVFNRSEVSGHEWLSCPRCPLGFIGNDARAPSLGEVAEGSFVEPGRQEAFIALDGCEGYEFSGISRGTFGRRVLLAEVDGQWKLVRYYPTNAPSFMEGAVRLRASDGTDVFFSNEGSGCRMGGCSTALTLTRVTEKRIEQRGVLTSDIDEERWSWSNPTVSDDGTVRVMLLPQQEDGEYIVEWKWDGDTLSVQRDDVTTLKKRGVSAKRVDRDWRPARSFD